MIGDVKKIENTALETAEIFREHIGNPQEDMDMRIKIMTSVYALGYLFGFVTALIKSKIRKEKVVNRTLKYALQELFGKGIDKKLLYSAQKEQHNQDFELGLEAALDDVGELLYDNKSPETLVKYLANIE